ncbi:MAG: transposase family protein [Deltaproteobacteria bacterium]|nr:transposase family protein [Deltaproteobacteria bacterium]
MAPIDAPARLATAPNPASSTPAGGRDTGCAPDQWRHLDVIVIRLLNGAKVYLHAVMDNFSRKVLAWQLSDEIMGQTTAAVVQQALTFVESADVHLLTDSGVENVNQGRQRLPCSPADPPRPRASRDSRSPIR